MVSDSRTQVLPMLVAREFLGELLGTFVLVFCGCGVLAVAGFTNAQVSTFQVAIVWGVGVALAIQLTNAASGAHLNPAITLAFAASKRHPWIKVPHYLLGQFIGAFLSAATVHLLFGAALSHFEAVHGIVRGLPGSEASAMVFGEYFPNPGWRPLGAPSVAGHCRAFLAELLGTALLTVSVLGLPEKDSRAQHAAAAAWGIGLTVMVLISLLGPLTMACFNPARDLGPRLFSACAGWGLWPFTANGPGWLTVYIIAPIVGAQLGTLCHDRVVARPKSN